MKEIAGYLKDKELYVGSNSIMSIHALIFPIAYILISVGTLVELYDIVIRKARVRFLDRLVDIAIRDGVIQAVDGEVKGRGEYEIDANGSLVTDTFVNPHLHMCKVYTLSMAGEEALKLYHGKGMEKSMRAIELASRVKEKYHESWIYENAKKAVLEGLKYGCTFIRAFADTDTKAKLEGVKALLKLKNEFKNTVDIQVVAFPQDGIIKDPGADEFVRKAIEMGADVVGGIPWIELTDDDAKKHIDIMFEIAKEHNKDIAMLTDDAGDPTLKTTEMLAIKTLREGWVGRVAACHARAMHLYPETYFRKLAALLKKGGISIITDPHTGPLHARVKDLIDEGVNVALGQDDIADAYYPYGRNKMLEIAFLASHLLWMTTLDNIETLYDMITINAAKAMGLISYCLHEGCEANIVVLNARSAYEAIWKQDVPRYVIRRGKIVVENREESRFWIEGLI